FRSLGRWDSSRPLRPWIMGIAVNRCRTSLAVRARHPRPQTFAVEDAVSPEQPAPDELAREIDGAIGQLRPEYQEAFRLFHDRGRPYEEIPLARKGPGGPVKTGLPRARLMVLRRLQERGMVSEIET